MSRNYVTPNIEAAKQLGELDRRYPGVQPQEGATDDYGAAARAEKIRRDIQEAQLGYASQEQALNQPRQQFRTTPLSELIFDPVQEALWNTPKAYWGNKLRDLLGR